MTSTKPPAGDQTTKTFNDFGVDPALCAALAEAGIHNPFPIQELTLPVALAGADIIGQARTGTGKTLAFGLPMLQRINPARSETQVLVVVPTRELCLQVAEDLIQAGSQKDIRVVAAYGGKAIDPQIRDIEGGAPIVVGTPGRLLDLVGRGVLDLSTANGLVLDEADEMLDLGFLPDVEQLIEKTSSDRQTLLFSATMPSAVVSLARRYMRKPTFLRADVEEVRIAPETRQHFFSCHRLDKPAVLARILQAPDRGLCVVFSRTKRMADILANDLRDRGIAASPIHSDLRQEARERALDRFRKGKIDVLVATEVAARGLDIDDVTHVVNYDCPDDEKMYLHRIGRTGRAGAAGVAVTLAVWNELARLEMIKRTLEITEPTHEVFSTSEILDELFDLPSREHKRPARAAVEDAEDSRDGRAGSRSGDERPERKSSSRRRRGRGRGAPSDRGREGDTSPKVATKSSSTDSKEQSSDDGDADSGEVRRRVRRRTVTRTSGEAAKDDDRTSSRDSSRTDSRRTDREASSGRPTRERTRTRSRSTGSAASSGGRNETRSDGNRSRANGKGSAKDTGSGDGDRQGRRRDGRGSSKGSRGQQGRSKSQSSARRERKPRVDADTARGDGKPRLRRPLEVVHLP